MQLQFSSTLIAVTDMARSRRFYQEVLGLNVISDFGANVVLDGGIALQTLETWAEFIGKDAGDIQFFHHAGELYFETEDMDGLLDELRRRPEIRLVHPPLTHSWGQRAVRIYDPDGHILELSERLGLVIRRFIREGLTPEQTAKRMDVPLDMVLSEINKAP